MTRTVLHQVLSPDGQTRLVFFRRTDGAISHIAEKFWIDDVPEYDYHAEYWAAFTDSSSIFDSLETAIRELRVEYPWLAAVMAKDD
ncbi:hypothetical protein LAV78_14540 [Brucella intermedia]|uniref:hypothetical protein n=1 Tax=Brucella intermedia TaxID=94625 RepID=UPI001E5EA5F5|nr:hypothetical protein [Brucella intermedia]MCB4919737.1 hypothetical protein [Brucella intermedia]